MVVFTIGFRSKSKLTKEIENVIIDSIGKKGFYACFNSIVDSDKKMHLNGKKAKKIIQVKNVRELIKKIERIHFEDVMIVYDYRYINDNNELVFLLAFTVSELKPKKAHLILIVDSLAFADNQFDNLKNNEHLNLYVTDRGQLFQTINDVSKNIAQTNFKRKIKFISKNQQENNVIIQKSKNDYLEMIKYL